MSAIDTIQFNETGMVPAIAQDHISGEILMMAWMNKEALSLSIETQQAVYYSRSRQKLWFKGEESGHNQEIIEIFTDCDHDVILLKVKQNGGIACHTGRANCFFNKLDNDDFKLIYLLGADNINFEKKNKCKLKLPLIILNIGGITNITGIDSGNNKYSCDAGPGNCLIDQWIRMNSKIWAPTNSIAWWRNNANRRSFW